MISVLLPVFNEGLYLRQCLESICSQQGCDFEVCISDNASTDETWTIICEFSQKYTQIKSVRHSLSLSRYDNLLSCVNQATGKYVYLIGGDDFLLPGFFSEAISRLKQTNAPSCVLAKMYYFDSKLDDVLAELPPAEFVESLNQNSDIVVRSILNHINHDEIVFGVFERNLFCKIARVISPISFEPSGIYLALGVILSAKNNHRVWLTEKVYLMKRNNKYQSDVEPVPLPCKYAKIKALKLHLYRYSGSLKNIYYFWRIGIINIKTVVLLLFAPRYHSSFKDKILFWGPIIYPVFLVFRIFYRLSQKFVFTNVR